MNFREALGGTRWSTLATTLLLGWVAWMGTSVVGAMQPPWQLPAAGQPAATGVVGLFVLLGVLGSLATLSGESAEATRQPLPWPPEE